jgi:hypothetical protein
MGCSRVAFAKPLLFSVFVYMGREAVAETWLHALRHALVYADELQKPARVYATHVAISKQLHPLAGKKRASLRITVPCREGIM